MFFGVTPDFSVFGEAQAWFDFGGSAIDAIVIKEGDTYYRYTKYGGGACGGPLYNDKSKVLYVLYVHIFMCVSWFRRSEYISMICVLFSTFIIVQLWRLHYSAIDVVVIKKGDSYIGIDTQDMEVGRFSWPRQVNGTTYS